MPVAAILEPIAIPPAPAPGARRSLVDDFLAAAEFAGEGDDAELGAALVLLSRVEADVAARLRVLARAGRTSAAGTRRAARGRPNCDRSAIRAAADFG